MKKSDSVKTGPSKTSAYFDVMLLLLPALMLWLAFADLNGWPQNDDPYYGRPVQWLTEEGQFQLAKQKGELSASTVAHVLMGTASTLLFGFSYRSLFLACIIQQWIGAAAIYGVGRTIGFGRMISVLLGFTFALQPLIFGNSFTFMTDTPAAAWAAVACYAYITAFHKHRIQWLIASSLIVGWGIWIRQTNLFVLGAPMLTVLLLAMTRRLPFLTVYAALAVLVPATISYGLMESGWIVEPTTDRVVSVSYETHGFDRLKQMAIAAYRICLNVGVFGLPLSLFLISAAARSHSTLKRNQRWICGAVSLATIVIVAIPFVISRGGACLTNTTGNYVQNGHAGPIFLADMDEAGRWGQLDGVEWPLVIWQIATVLVIAVDGLIMWWVAWLVTNWWSVQSSETESSPQSAEHAKDQALQKSIGNHNESNNTFDALTIAISFFAMAAVSSVVLLLLIEPLLDRHLLILLAPLICMLTMALRLSSWKPDKATLIGTAVLLAAIYAFNVVYTHDLLTWNDCRWRQVQSWLNGGLAPAQFDGGRDVNAWLRLAEDKNSFNRPGDTSTWWSGYAELCITVGPRQGWEQSSEIPWQSWATGRTHHLYVLKKPTAHEPPKSQ